MRKSLTAIKKYILKQYNTILLAKTNSFIKRVIYIAQMQKNINNGKPLFKRYINLGIGL